MTIERWKSIPGFEGKYVVSDHGRIATHSRVVKCAYGASRRVKAQYLKPLLTTYGYHDVQFRVNGKARHFGIHNLVMEAFVGPRPKHMVVNHLDMNRQNNNLSNLEYTTRSGNALHALSNGVKFGYAPKAVMRSDGKKFPSITSAAKAIGGWPASVSNSCRTGSLAVGYRFNYVS